VSLGNLINATAIGANAIVDASNKVRLGDTVVTMIQGQVAFTAVSDKTQKENFQPVDGEEVLGKISGFELSSWNFIGHDPKAFRHYGPMAQDFFAAFGHDGLGQIGSETTINSGDLAGILMIAVQALEKRTAELKQKEAKIAVLASEVEELKAKHAYFETVVARLDALELRSNHSIQITAEKNLSFVTTGE
jgi:endosialidase-like protein